MITRDNCWSVRQCFERADQLSDEAARIASDGRLLMSMSAETLIARQRELIAHLCVNLKAGFATPATPPPDKLRASMPPVVYAQPSPMPKPLPANAQLQAVCRAEAHRTAKQLGLLNAADAKARLGVCNDTFYRMQRANALPEPRMTLGREKWWHPDDLDRTRAGVRFGKG